MAEREYLNDKGLGKVAANVNKRLKVVSVMPDSADVGAVRLYIGAATADCIKGGIYQYNGTEWELINASGSSGGTTTWVGLSADWELLDDDVKANYDSLYFLDDIASGFMNVSDIVQAEDYNPVTSNAVAEAIAANGHGAQTDTMPEASEDNAGEIVQYVGETTDDYVNGYFYKSTYDSENDTYGWEPIDVSPTLTEEQVTALLALI